MRTANLERDPSRPPHDQSDLAAGPDSFLVRIEDAPANRQLQTPVLVMDVAAVVSSYARLVRALPGCRVYYAVKANPAPEILDALAACGSSFDVASQEEIVRTLAIGVTPARLSFGHTVKKASAIALAHAAGVDLFALDSTGELQKIADHAPGARVMVRLQTNGRGAEWPLSRKFGCDPAMAFDLLLEARALGLIPYGLTFHVGSQQTDPSRWDEPVALAARLVERARSEGIRLQMLNLGGGFPAQYRGFVPPIEAYGAAIGRSLAHHFERDRPDVIVEPGRHLVADAGIIRTEVILVARKSYGDETRWVYLDCGKFGGLAETMDEAIKYRLRTPGRRGRPTRVVLAGPTCDSADILYERCSYYLPDDLQAGDRVEVLSAGAYTYPYASIGFNGFAPLSVVCV
jgi:ornithine decarboxylase